MAHFKKQILGVGTLYPSDGEPLVITPERLKAWDSGFKSLKKNKQRLPVHFDHPKNEDGSYALAEMLPKASDKFQKKRGAFNTVGELVDFTLTPDGNSAELTVELFDDKAIKAVKADKVQLSPVILDSFRDGDKNDYADIVGGADLVNRPVDAHQGPFVPVGAIACALSLSATKQPKVYLMAFDDKEKDDDEPKDDEMPKDGDGDGELNEGEPEADEAELTGRNAQVARVVSVLAEFGVTLPEDTDMSNFFDRIETAVTAIKASREADGETIQLQPQPKPRWWPQ